uniref:Alpha-soluble NSF attachment protein n=1 Tax=Steinernema glaseri TaxID=37863 RepID=A0A1I7ZHX6_9BILA
MADPNEQKARQKFAEAERKAKGGNGFFSFFSGSKADEAADLFVQAGNLFKICNCGKMPETRSNAAPKCTQRWAMRNTTWRRTTPKLPTATGK